MATFDMDDEHSNGPSRADVFGQPSSTLRLRDQDAADGREADESTDAEARMRQALGLFGTRGSAHSDRGHHDGHGGGGRTPSGGAGTRRHRFVQDGEVPVSMVRPRAPQLRTGGAENDRHGEEQLAAERQARLDAERRLADREVQLRSLQTRIGHAELERDAALADAREWREKAEQILAESRLVATAAAPAHALSSPDGEVGSAVEAAAADEQAGVGPRRGLPRRRGEEAMPERIDPEPVKWWL